MLPLFFLSFFRLYAFIEAATFRSIVLRYAGAPIATRVSFFFVSFFLIGNVAFSECFFVPLPFSLCMESASYVFPFRMVFFHLVTTGWIFDIIINLYSITRLNTYHVVALYLQPIICISILLLLPYLIVSVLFLPFFWCPCMAINVSVQYNGELLPDIILLTQCYFQRGTRLYAMKRFCICSL